MTWLAYEHTYLYLSSMVYQMGCELTIYEHGIYYGWYVAHYNKCKCEQGRVDKTLFLLFDSQI